jgi:uncharacterized cupin superfamily protein
MRMTRENFLSNEGWSDVDDESQVRRRIFGRPLGAMLGASLLELLPGAPGIRLHMHYGMEEIFFVLSGRPTLYNGASEEQLAEGDIVFCAEGRDGLHTFRNTTNEPVRLLAISSCRLRREQGPGRAAGAHRRDRARPRAASRSGSSGCRRCP